MSKEGWTSKGMPDFVASLAEGELEFLFVVAHVQDPARSAIAELLSESPTVSARILIATHTTANSQKIHKCVAAPRQAHTVLPLDIYR